MGNYNKLLEKAKGVYKTCTTDAERKVIESIFPDVKESDDERIMKEILGYFKDLDEHGYPTKEWTAWVEKHGKNDSQAIVPTFTFDDVLALECCRKEVEKEEELYNQLQSLHNRVHDAYWLNREEEQKETICNKCRREQPCHSCQDITELRRCALEHQCEQKSNKVEPKFKVGDWIICGGLNPMLITNIKNNKYEFEFIDGAEGFSDIDYIDSNFHLWTIEDAKDGDVLAGHEYYVIFKEIDGLNIRCHCAYHYMGYNTSFYVETLQNKTAFHPATKEQRDFLFQKMNEAGYKWDANRKEMVSVLKYE